ncbi:MAG: 4-hydroxy-tetrahydrodipicolinate synthase [Gammaproteobacteria bacterium]|nr:4-hydroxy-tetrahydrodipicolinate synthase [Gammaproteobacteria bacterium]
MFEGSMVALVTPMHEDGSLDLDTYCRLIDVHVEAGTRAIVAVGTTGESATLDHDEHCAVVRAAVQHARGRIPVIAGSGSNSTQEAIELTRCAADAGADACLLVTPYYNKPGPEGLFRHFQAIAAAVAIPQILYNVPGRTACDMLADTVIRLSAIDNIIGIKEATADPQRARDILKGARAGFEVYSGDDATARELMLLGCHGVISVTANVAPALMSEMCGYALAGDARNAADVDDRLAGLHQSLFVEANPIPVKWCMKEQGLMEGGIRLPLTPLAGENHQALRQAMQRAGVL